MTGVSFVFLSPKAALVALAVVVPLFALTLVARRADRLRAALGVPRARRVRLAVPMLATLLVAALVGAAAAQPVAEQETALEVRTDAEVYVVLDVSRSMLAKSGLGGAMRLDRARSVAVRLRAALPDVPVGVASLTDRLLPHLFPSPDGDVFRATVDLAIDIERPAPRSSFITTATSFDALAAAATQRFFSPSAQRRAIVVLTDGESQGINAGRLARVFRRPPGVSAVFVHFWGRDERVFNRGLPEPQYRPDPAARADLEGLAEATGSTVFGENAVDAASARVRALLERGPTVEEGVRKTRVALAPYLLVAALLPLGVLLWRRDR